MIKSSPKERMMARGKNEALKRDFITTDSDLNKYPGQEVFPKKRKVDFVSADVSDGIKPEISDTVDIKSSAGRNSQVY